MGTVEEIKEHILESLSTTTKWYTDTGLDTTFFRGALGGDGLALLGMGSAPKLQRALNELVDEGKLESRDREDSKEKEYRVPSA